MNRLYRDTRNAGLLAGAYLWRRANRHTTFIAVTGSSGKTTSRNCLGAILSRVGPTFVTEGNKNASIGLSKNLLRVRPAHRYAVIEIGIDAPRQMRRRAGTVAPHMVVALGVADTHPRGLPTLDVVAREKARALAALRPGGIAVLSGSDPRVRTMSAPQASRTVFFGDCPDSVARASDVRATLSEGLTFTLDTPRGRLPIQIGLYGEHWVPGVLGAVAAALALDVPLDVIRAGLALVRPHMSRCEPVVLPNGAILIRDEHNGGVPSFLAAIGLIRSVQARQRILILSNLHYLGDDPGARFQWIAERIRTAVDRVIFVGPHADIGARSARQAGMAESEVFGFNDLSEATEVLPRLTGDGDVILLRGRRLDHLERIVFAQFGRVSCWKALCDLRRACDTCEALEARDRAGRPVALPPLPFEPELR